MCQALWAPLGTGHIAEQDKYRPCSNGIFILVWKRQTIKSPQSMNKIPTKAGREQIVQCDRNRREGTFARKVR